jgi:uncharacterized membrane protein YsdA (DUF1294 family)
MTIPADLPINIFLSFLLLANTASFILVLWDKKKSIGNSKERIPEGLLFFSGVSFGALGAYASMFIFRHKTKRWYFLIGFPLLLIENFATAYLIYGLLVGKNIF